MFSNMLNLLMISGAGATAAARGEHNAFYATLEGLQAHFERIDVVCGSTGTLWDKVFFHTDIPRRPFDVMTVHEYAPFRNGRKANAFWKTTKIPMMFEIMHIPGVPRSGGWRELGAIILTGD
jgi:hypothetical protein